jgi:trans-aconitate 2-methyltransferase
MADWNPDLYNRFRRYRAEPVDAILERLSLGESERIVDLGCGSGEHTAELARRSSRGSALGIDSSAAMIDRAMLMHATLEPGLARRVKFERGDIRDFAGDCEWSVIFSNAAIQWLADHRAIFTACHRALAPGGRMVVQMPANEEELAQATLLEMAGQEPWSSQLGFVKVPSARVGRPDDYTAMLAELGYIDIDCYYHTFHHPMTSPAEIVEWSMATTLRPFLSRLSADNHQRFIDAWRRRIEAVYGTTGPLDFAFRRLFIWARRRER